MENLYKLIAPDSFWAMSEDEINKTYSGCGPGKVGDYIIPDEIWGLDISLCCKIHDHDYKYGKTWEDKVIADEHFLANINILISLKTPESDHMLRELRTNMAQNYFDMVKWFGGSAFWHGKERERYAV